MAVWCSKRGGSARGSLSVVAAVVPEGRAVPGPPPLPLPSSHSHTLSLKLSWRLRCTVFRGQRVCASPCLEAQVSLTTSRAVVRMYTAPWSMPVHLLGLEGNKQWEWGTGRFLFPKFFYKRQLNFALSRLISIEHNLLNRMLFWTCAWCHIQPSDVGVFPRRLVCLANCIIESAKMCMFWDSCFLQLLESEPYFRVD